MQNRRWYELKDPKGVVIVEALLRDSELEYLKDETDTQYQWSEIQIDYLPE